MKALKHKKENKMFQIEADRRKRIGVQKKIKSVDNIKARALQVALSKKKYA